MDGEVNVSKIKSSRFLTDLSGFPAMYYKAKRLKTLLIHPDIINNHPSWPYRSVNTFLPTPVSANGKV
jgi:hypothetical protein